MNLGSILDLGCLCRPFPAGFTNLGGGRQPRSIGLSTWTVHVDKSSHFRQFVPKGRSELPFRALGYPQDRQ